MLLRHTKSLSNHFALLPRSHRGPVSVLAGYSALFISAPGSYLLSPGSQLKCFFLPKKGRSDKMSKKNTHAMSFQFIGVLHRPFFFIPLTKQHLLGCLSLLHREKSYLCSPSWQYKNLPLIVAAESISVQFSSVSSGCLRSSELQNLPFLKKYR